MAEKGLAAAKRYSEIAPAAPHAQHMPSHIFTRVGYWKESIASNAESARSAKASNEAHDQLHAMDYLVYAYLQMGQDAKAQAVIDEMRGMSGFTETFIAGPYALAVSPARYAIERGDWPAAAQLSVRSSPLAHVEAMTHFARAVGAARSGNPDAAKADIAKLAELREKLRAAKDAYWAEQVDIQWQVATAWVLYAEGKYEDALKAMSAAADAEDKTDKQPVTPGVPTPARELYGAMLLERGMPKEALAAFEATLKKEPNRLGATLGAGTSAEKSGDPAKARQYYTAGVALTENADPVRPQIAPARGFVAKSARASPIGAAIIVNAWLIEPHHPRGIDRAAQRGARRAFSRCAYRGDRGPPRDLCDRRRNGGGYYGPRTPDRRCSGWWAQASNSDVRFEGTLMLASLKGFRRRVGAFIGGFEARLANRRLKGFQPSRAHLNTLIAASGLDITSRARWLLRNNGNAANAIESWAGNVAGSGIKPSSLIRDPQLKTRVQELWLDWTDEADAEALLTCTAYSGAPPAPLRHS